MLIEIYNVIEPNSVQLEPRWSYECNSIMEATMDVIISHALILMLV